MNKKIMPLILLFAAVLTTSSTANAAFSIELNFPDLNFGNMNMGDIKDDVPPMGLIVTCTTDLGNPWSLNIRNDWPLMHVSNPSSVISNTDFKWYGVSTSDPANTSLIMTREDFTFERTIYNGAAGEGANGTDIMMKFELTLPSLLQSGLYTSNIVFTLTE